MLDAGHDLPLRSITGSKLVSVIGTRGAEPFPFSRRLAAAACGLLDSRICRPSQAGADRDADAWARSLRPSLHEPVDAVMPAVIASATQPPRIVVSLNAARAAAASLHAPGYRSAPLVRYRRSVNRQGDVDGRCRHVQVVRGRARCGLSFTRYGTFDHCLWTGLVGFRRQVRAQWADWTDHFLPDPTSAGIGTR